MATPGRCQVSTRLPVVKRPVQSAAPRSGESRRDRRAGASCGGDRLRKLMTRGAGMSTGPQPEDNEHAGHHVHVTAAAVSVIDGGFDLDLRLATPRRPRIDPALAALLDDEFDLDVRLGA